MPKRGLAAFWYAVYVFRKFIDGDNPLQQGGDAVFDANWKLIKIFPMLHVADRVSVDDLLNC